MPIPRFFSGYLDQTDLSPAFKLPSTSIAQGQITPDQLGMQVWNASGSDIAVGKLVYVSGWNVTHAMPQIDLAVASGRYTGAQFVTLAAITNGSAGPVGLHFSLTAQNTNAATAGDPVYLGTTAGGYTMTTPSATAGYYQVVGRVAVKSASVGLVDFNILSGVAPQPDAYRFSASLITIPTAAGATEQLVCPGRGGTLTALELRFPVGLVASDTNYITVAITDKGTNGAGTTQFLATSPAGTNTTKATGGTAITAYVPYVLTLATGPFTVAQRDVFDVTITGTGTLPNTLPGGSI